MEAAVDNDLILKAVCYGLANEFWPTAKVDGLGILGAARYVVSDQIKRGRLNRDDADVRSDLDELLGRCEALEPTEAEIALAAEVELYGQELGLALDNGESQLAAIIVTREIPLLETGDKRAIAGLEQLGHHLEAFEGLRKRVRCLEQIALRLVGDSAAFERISTAICAEQAVDKSLSVCFGCFGSAPAEPARVLEALDQYVHAVRKTAPEVLVDEY